jgi:hypothetical protein
MGDFAPANRYAGPFKVETFKNRLAACVGKKLAGKKDPDQTQSAGSEAIVIRVCNNCSLLEDASLGLGGAEMSVAGMPMGRYMGRHPFKGLVLGYMAAGGIRAQIATIPCDNVKGVPEGDYFEVKVPHGQLIRIFKTKVAEVVMQFGADGIEFLMDHQEYRNGDVVDQRTEEVATVNLGEDEASAVDTMWQLCSSDELKLTHHVQISAMTFASWLREVADSRSTSTTLTACFKRGKKEGSLILTAQDGKSHPSRWRHKFRLRPGDTSCVHVDVRDDMTASEAFFVDKTKHSAEEEAVPAEESRSTKRIRMGGGSGIKVGAAAAAAKKEEDDADDYNPDTGSTVGAVPTASFDQFFVQQVSRMDDVARMETVDEITFRLNLMDMAIGPVSGSIGTLHLLLFDRMLIIVGPELHTNGVVIGAFGAIADE